VLLENARGILTGRSGDPAPDTAPAEASER